MSAKILPTTKWLLTGVSAVALLSGSARAQSTASPPPPSGAVDDGDIIVTGIRGSLFQAIETKRLSNSIVDSISSESLGKFPDSNIAEALQRIPGVSIDRSGGEGRFVTVRGFGPEFNTVLINGRTFASDNEGRQFSFDLLAAELITGADVYKSANATLQDGGIGATLNVKTARPFDLKGFKLIASGRGLYEENSKQVSPQGFLLYSDTFADDKFGVTLAFSYQGRNLRRPFVDDRGYLPGSTVGPSAAPLFRNVYAPRNQDIGVETQERERIGFNGTVQYRPIDDVVVTIDGLYNRFKVDSDQRALGSWFEPSSYTAAAIDANRTVTSLTTQGNGDLIVTSNNRNVTTSAAGGNVAWTPNANVTLKADVSWSRAADTAGGTDVFTVIGIPSRYSFAEAVGDGFPSILNYSSSLTNPNLGRAHIALRQGNDRAEEVFESKFDGEWRSDGGAFKALRFGLVYTQRNKNNQLVQSDPNTLCLYCGYATAASPALLTPFSLGNFVNGPGTVPTTFLTYDPNAYFAFLESTAAANANDVALGRAVGTTAAQLRLTNGYAATPQPSSYQVRERTYAGYLDTDFNGQLGGMNWNANIGVRYVFTEVQAAGSQLTLTDILRVPNDPTIYNAVFQNGGVPTSTVQSSSYAYLLPNINLKLDVIDTIAVRFGASRSLTRPQISNLAPRVNFDTIRPASLDASGGNPNLRPYTSDNFDLSFEWYPKRNISFAVAPFFKRISNFIVQTRADESFPILNSGNITAPGISGTNVVFSTRRPRNTESANVRGIEIAGNIAFDFLPGWLSGFGLNGNATFVSSNASFAPGSTTQSFALEGLGNSWNISGYYERGKISTRVAYNSRGRFLEYLVTPGQGGDPVYRRQFNQLDVRASYQVIKQVQVFFEGINVLGEQNVQTGRFDNQVLNISNTGARYALGARADF